MSITTLDGLIGGFQKPINFFKTTALANVAGRYQSTYQLNGWPGGGLSGDTFSNGLSGTSLSTVISGCLDFPNPTGTNKTYLTKFSLNSSAGGRLILCDRLWYNSMTAVTSTSLQTINSVPFPSRDMTGGTNGAGVMIGVEVQQTLGAGTPTYTMTYVNEHGVSGNTVVTAPMVASMVQGSFIPIPLGSGHTGVQQIQTWQQSATHTSGRYSLVAYRPIASVDVPVVGVGGYIDAFSSGFPELYNNSNLFFLWFPTSTTVTNVSGQIILAQG